jgi:hypothetical protein
MQAQVETLQAEQKSLKAQIDELQPVVDSADFYEQEMTRFEKEVAAVVEEYPVNVIYEDGIIYIVDLTDELDIKVPSLTVTPAASISSVEGTGVFDGKSYNLLSASEDLTYTAKDYDSLKALLDYIYADENSRKTITAVSMAFDSTSGKISGSMSVNVFAMSDGQRVYEPIELPLDSLGVENIFGEVQEAEENND